MEKERIETATGNRLLARYMGGAYNKSNDDFMFVIGNCPTKDACCMWDTGALQYRSSWEWIMNVVKKIEEIRHVSVYISKTQHGQHTVEITHELPGRTAPSKTILVRDDDKLEAVWTACVMFVEWYGENKHLLAEPNERPPMVKNLNAEKCPVCGAPEIPVMSPRTHYACGSSDYDQLPGTFVQSEQCMQKNGRREMSTLSEYESVAYYRCHLAIGALDKILTHLDSKFEPEQKCKLRFKDIKLLLHYRKHTGGGDLGPAIREYTKLYKLRGMPGPNALAIVDEHGKQLTYFTYSYYSVTRDDQPRTPRPHIQLRPLAESLEEHRVDNGAENLAGASFSITIPNFNGPYRRDTFINRHLAPHDGFAESVTNGVYLLYDKGEVVYVGSSNELRKRIPQHSDKQYDSFAFIVTEEYPHVIEALLISMYKPKYNTVGARPHKPRKNCNC